MAAKETTLSVSHALYFKSLFTYFPESSFEIQWDGRDHVPYFIGEVMSSRPHSWVIAGNKDTVHQEPRLLYVHSKRFQFLAYPCTQIVFS